MSSDERRKSILDVAKDLFSRKGYLGVTTRQLAAAVGVTEPVLYGHFRSKRRLYEEVLLVQATERLAGFMKQLEPYEEARDDQGFFAAVAHAFMHGAKADSKDLRFLLQVLLEGGDSSKLFYANQIRPVHERIQKYIELRVEEGAFRPPNSKIAARQFIAFFIYHKSLQRLIDDTFMADVPPEAMQETVETFLLGVQKIG